MAATMAMRETAVLAAGALLLLAAVSPARAVSIAEKGVARAVVVVAKDAPPPVRHAADELASFLNQVTGGTFKVTDKPPAGAGRLLVGPGAARRADPQFTTDGLGADGIVIRTVGGDLILAGGHPRGTLYAVYTFLGDPVGCRWWSSKVSTIPARPTLAAEGLDIRYVPPLEYREAFWFDAFDGDFAVRSRCNGHAARLDAKRGGKHRYEGFVHTFYRLIPPKTYFKDHPEWFSEIDGKRTAHRRQLCLTNEAMRKELVANLAKRLRANPAATIASVSQNDWHGACRCPRCAAIDAEEGGHAGTLIRFVNAVAADLEKDFPHVAFSTLAYQYTRKPPKRVRPRSNVIVRLCSIECSFSRPLTHGQNKTFRDDIVGWSKICNRLYIWDYVTNFRHHVLPHPNLRVLAANVKFFAAHGAKGIFEQGAYTTAGAEMAELRAWVLARLLWDPTLDGAKLIDEFLDGYYGPAGRHVAAYLDVTHDAAEAAGEAVGCFSKHQAKFLSFQTLRRGWAHLKAAEAAVEGDADLRFRVQVAQLPVMYALMMRWDHFKARAEADKAPWPMEESIGEVHKRFVAVAGKKGITRLDEWNPGYGALDKAVKAAKR